MKPSLLDEDDVDVLHEGLVEATIIGLLKISHVIPMLQVLAFSSLVGMDSHLSTREECASSSLV